MTMAGERGRHSFTRSLFTHSFTHPAIVYPTASCEASVDLPIHADQVHIVQYIHAPYSVLRTNSPLSSLCRGRGAGCSVLIINTELELPTGNLRIIPPPVWSIHRRRRRASLIRPQTAPECHRRGSLTLRPISPAQHPIQQSPEQSDNSCHSHGPFHLQRSTERAHEPRATSTARLFWATCRCACLLHARPDCASLAQPTAVQPHHELGTIVIVIIIIISISLIARRRITWPE